MQKYQEFTPVFYRCGVSNDRFKVEIKEGKAFFTFAPNRELQLDPAQAKILTMQLGLIEQERKEIEYKEKLITELKDEEYHINQFLTLYCNDEAVQRQKEKRLEEIKKELKELEE